MVKEEKLEYVANERFAGLADAGELKPHSRPPAVRMLPT